MSPCTSPVPYEKLVALWTGELAAEDARLVEEHLFECDPCAAASQRLGLLITELRGHLPGVISHAHRERLAAAGLRIFNTEVQPGVDARAFFARDLDLMVHVLHGELAEAERVDLEFIHEGAELLRFENVPFDPVSGEVLIACQRHFEAMFPTFDPAIHVIAHKGEARWQVGSYVVHHDWP
jgi:hypothetical protein